MSIENAKAMLPNIPDEIFDIWLSALIEEISWPFKQLTDPTIGTSWELHLGELTPGDFAKLVWNKDVLTMDTCVLEQFSKMALQTFISKSSKKDGTIGNGYLKNSESRIRSHISCIERTERLFAPIILIKTLAGFCMLDGYHRMTAVHLSQKPDIKIDAWIGE